jgi:hypothetical protein
MLENKRVRIDIWYKFPGYKVQQDSTSVKFDDDDAAQGMLTLMYNAFLTKCSELGQDFDMEAYVKSGDEMVWMNGKFTKQELLYRNEEILTVK